MYRNMLISVSCDCTTVKNVVTGNSSSKPDRTGRDGKFVKHQKCLITLHIVGWVIKQNMSRVIRKPTFCICANKDADQFRGNREANQRLCFRYIDSTIHLLSTSEILSLAIFCSCTASFVSDQVGNQHDVFLITRFINCP